MGQNDFRLQLRKAYRRLLNPLVRILIRNGFTAIDTQELIRQVFVDAATSGEFEIEGQSFSDSRVAILTGLTRKEVHRLRIGGKKEVLDTTMSVIGRLIAGWNQDPDFTGPYGLPLALSRESDRRKDKDAPSFDELVRRHSGDVPPEEMLDELLRTGLAIHEMETGLIRNTGRTYIPHQLDPAALERLGKVISRIADTLDINNSQIIEEKRFEREVKTDIGLTAEQSRQFDIYLRQKCQELLETLDNWLANQEGRVDAHRYYQRIPRKRVHTGVGVYHFVDRKLPFEDDD